MSIASEDHEVECGQTLHGVDDCAEPRGVRFRLLHMGCIEQQHHAHPVLAREPIQRLQASELLARRLRPRRAESGRALATWEARIDGPRTVGGPHFICELIHAHRPHDLQLRDDLVSGLQPIDRLEQFARVVARRRAPMFEVGPQTSCSQETVTHGRRCGRRCNLSEHKPRKASDSDVTNGLPHALR
jgi:hypothetical protein